MTLAPQITSPVRPAAEMSIDELVVLIAAERNPEAPPNDAAMLTELAGHIRAGFASAWQHRQTSGVSDRLRNCFRLRKGEYTPAILTEIRKYGGSELYFNLVAQKCEAAAAWIDDQLGPENYEPELEPTPISDLPESEIADIDNRVWRAVSGAMVQLQFSDALRAQLIERKRKMLEASAAERAEAMVEKIKDQFSEGGFHRAFTEFVDHLTTYPTAFLKGPEIRMQKRHKWGADGLRVVEEPVTTWRSPHPSDMYPGANTAHPDEGEWYEAVKISLDEIKAFKDQPYWFASEIDAVLAEDQPASELAYLPDELERAQGEGRDTTINAGLAAGMVCAIERWGAAPCEFRYRDPEGAEKSCAKGEQIRAILVGSHVVHAMPNPDLLGRRPYSFTSYKKVPGSVWGVGLPEKGEPIQVAANACARNLIDDLAFSSGPQIGVDLDSVENADKFTFSRPRQIFGFHSSRLRQASMRPVEWFQPPSNASKLQSCYEFFANMMDDVTLIPRYVQGNGDVRGAGQTASGMSMLMSAAGKGLRAILSNIDLDVLRPRLEAIYFWNLQYLDDAQWSQIKGDCRVRPTGPLQVMSRELTDMRVQEQLQLGATNDKIYSIIGQEGLANLYRYALERQKVPVKVVPSEEELSERAESERRESAMMAQTQGAPAAARPEEFIPLSQPVQPAPEAGIFGGEEAYGA